MKYIDLTHTITENMPVYPGTEKPVLERIEVDGYRETLFHIFSHTGTHIDAPYHIFKNGRKLEEFEIHEFVGSAAVISIPQGVKTITPEMLRINSKIDFMLLNTGWDKKWNHEDYFSDFPVMSLEAAEYAANLGLKGIGLDCISVDPVGVDALPVHKVLLSSDMLIIENLTNLDKLPLRVQLTALPLKFTSADGCSARVFACFE